jgi:hypothetical protein
MEVASVSQLHLGLLNYRKKFRYDKFLIIEKVPRISKKIFEKLSKKLSKKVAVFLMKIYKFLTSNLFSFKHLQICKQTIKVKHSEIIMFFVWLFNLILIYK